ncbi:type II toxin-antitoxin system VapC family toxin [Methylobacterium organophilum]|uniref:type II toxin-antitoxin system VapC family toxin n=1 Tax=Methylobacterium organophilum TaxID=410 RepID=UPI001F13D27E|nr:type II toxin-antitoxin system VapC family toxin [Methylobacterium organophilum]UMY18898.1 type II toxin-antitoxin system VapC family toxin [Methylobacterium organophilum]
MIVVDTSALMAILLGDAEADRCAAVLEAEDRVFLSSGTMAEALIVAARRNLGDEMKRLIDGLGFEIVSVTAATAVGVGQAYERWGKGVHPAALNFGDCFAYALAREKGCPLLSVGDDFTQTDLDRA